MNHNPHHSLMLTAVDGANPLGFMVALGVLHLLHREHREVKISWAETGGTWHPVIHGLELTREALSELLHAQIIKADLSIWTMSCELPFEANVLRVHAIDAVERGSMQAREELDLLASLGVDFFRDEDGKFESTSFQLVRSKDNTGNGLLAYAAYTIKITTVDQIRNCMFDHWKYADEKKSFRWDPAEDRSYALQWNDPSSDGALSERGANCLALFGLTFFPVIPLRDYPQTTGFISKKSKTSAFTWPIWTCPAGIKLVRTLINRIELQSGQPEPALLLPRGIVAAYRSDRMMPNKYYANFTPGRRVA